MSEGHTVQPDAWGILPAYDDAFGNRVETAEETRRALIVAMGTDPDGPGPPVVDDVLVVRQGEVAILPGAVEIVREDGEVVATGSQLPGDLPAGYHDVRVSGRDAPVRLIVSPGVCHLPEGLRTWGLAVQLYALRSAGSWGIGDLADLAALAWWAADRGAGTVLVNPLGSVAPTRPREASPYFPSTRRFLDWIYLRVTDVPGGAELTTDADLADGPIDRDRVAALKLAALEEAYRRAPSDPDHDRYVEHGGEDLRSFATWQVAAERFGGDWRRWPAELRHPSSPEVARLGREHDDRVRFHTWLQWCADRQLERAGQALRLGGDLPIGADPGGFDAWQYQDLLADGVTVGAPPDELGPQGQDWKLPAFVPWKLRAAGYEPYITTLRAAFRHTGLLRIDHVLGLFRLFWIPPGGTAADGAYVAQPTRELLDILALESRRARAIVVGEDLGTVQPGVRHELYERRILRYHVGWFEDGPPETWSPFSLASLSTHDLPTVAGVWTGYDLEELDALGLEPDREWFGRLRQRLESWAAPGVELEDATLGAHRALAAAPSAVVLAQLEDLVGAVPRVNVPGTQPPLRANWTTPLPTTLEGLTTHPVVSAVLSALADARPASSD